MPSVNKEVRCKYTVMTRKQWKC